MNWNCTLTAAKCAFEAKFTCMEGKMQHYRIYQHFLYSSRIVLNFSETAH